MKSDKRIFGAFLLNLLFSVFELIGGLLTNSYSILSDSLHDLGDATGLGVSALLEKKSKKGPNERYTYGYGGYSLIGALITNCVLLVGALVVILGAIDRIIHPIRINYNGMIIFAIVGTVINLISTFFTRDGKSLNQKAVNLHMLEDALGWIAVLVCAFIIKFTNFYILDPILSILLSLFIIFIASKNLKECLDVVLIKTPKEISLNTVKETVEKIDGVKQVHHIHAWSLDGEKTILTMHVVKDVNASDNLKQDIKQTLLRLGVNHSTLEFEENYETCGELDCQICSTPSHLHHHHHGHGRHGHENHEHEHDSHEHGNHEHEHDSHEHENHEHEHDSHGHGNLEHEHDSHGHGNLEHEHDSHESGQSYC